MLQSLNQIFKALRTIYIEQVDFTFDHTTTHVSNIIGGGR
jgi:hypothetical protein